MADVLSQGEVESLLAALGPSNKKKTNPNKPKAAPGNGNRAINVYDFKRPERVSKEQMRAFQALHDGFGREFGASLSSMLRTIVEVKLISVDQLTYSEFVFSVENPTCFNLLRSNGLDGHLILDLNPTIIFPIFDRLLGGGRESRQNIPSRPLTDIEMRLVGRITDLAIKGLESAWERLCQLNLSVVQVESNPQLVQIVPPNEVIVLISFEITMGDIRGIMNLCIPFNTIEPLAGKLSSDTWSAYTKKVADTRQRLNLETHMAGAGVEVVVHLAETTISAGDLATLAVGDIVTTEQEQTSPLTVLVEGRPMFTAYPGVLKWKKAIRIGEVIARPQDLVDQKVREAESQTGGSEPTAD